MIRPYRDRLRRARQAAGRWFVAEVHGTSMSPTLEDGDLVLVDQSRSVVVGCLAVLDLPDGTRAVKRVTRAEPGGWWVERDNPRRGVDSWSVGAIPADAVLGVVLHRLWPRPRSLVRP
jgi:phage repressor protein C with HTH and peptisase S24 domain